MRNSGTKYSKWSNIVSYADYLTTAHIARVAQQGGTIDSPALLNLYVQYLVSNNLMSSQYIGAIPSVTGYKIQAGTTQNCQIVFSVDPAGSTSGAYIGDMSQATLLNQPKLLKYAGEKYYWGNDVEGNYCVSNFSSKVMSDFTIETKVTINNFITNYGNFIATYGDTFLYFYYNDTKKLILDTAGGHVKATVDVPFNDGDTFFIKVVKVGTLVQIFTKHLVTDSWTQLGTNLTLASATIGSFTRSVVGAYSVSTSVFNFSGNIYYVKLYDNSGDIVNFDFTNFNPAVSETTWTATTGETWTLNTSPLNNELHSTIVTRTCTVDCGILHFESGVFNVGTLTIPAAITRFVIKNIKAKSVSNGGNLFRCAFAGSANAGYYQYQTLFSGTEVVVDALYSSYWGNYGYNGYGLQDTIFPLIKTNIITQRFNKSSVEDLQINKNATLVNLAYAILEPLWLGDLTQGYGIATVAGDWKGHITFNGVLSDAQKAAFQDFLNTTIFNGEIY